jgi:hypothetical protein
MPPVTYRCQLAKEPPAAGVTDISVAVWESYRQERATLLGWIREADCLLA